MSMTVTNIDVSERYDFILTQCRKQVHVLKGDRHWDVEWMKEKCLDNLNKIEAFCHAVLFRQTVVVGSNKMQVYLQVDDFVNNACWDPTGRFAEIGVTDPASFDAPLATKLDTIAHEFGHGIVFCSGNFDYKDQGGALHESFADIFAIMVKHFTSKEVAENPCADWLIGDGKMRGGKKIGAMRSLAHPGQAHEGDVAPKHLGQIDPFYATYYSNPKNEFYDLGGVHFYANIPNHAFYLAATAVGGPCYREIGHIWTNSVWNGETKDNFSTFAARTIESASLLGYSRNIQNIVAKAWSDVGVDLRRPIPPPEVVRKTDEQTIAEMLLQYYKNKQG